MRSNYAVSCNFLLDAHEDEVLDSIVATKCTRYILKIVVFIEFDRIFSIMTFGTFEILAAHLTVTADTVDALETAQSKRRLVCPNPQPNDPAVVVGSKHTPISKACALLSGDALFVVLEMPVSLVGWLDCRLRL